MLEVRKLRFAYPNSQQLLYDGFSMQVQPQERVALAAPSGYGKTTLCRLLAGFELPQQGQILVDGNPLPQKGACPVQLIGQHPELAVDPRMRLRDTLSEAGPIDESTLDALGIRTSWLARYPHELSGGELQRFCIARALAVKPRYLIADEISTMLDAVTQARIWRYLLQQVGEQNMGLVFVTHSPALQQRIATRVLDLS